MSWNPVRPILKNEGKIWNPETDFQSNIIAKCSDVQIASLKKIKHNWKNKCPEYIFGFFKIGLVDFLDVEWYN